VKERTEVMWLVCLLIADLVSRGRRAEINANISRDEYSRNEQQRVDLFVG
jgi:hypothetical protein